VLVGLFMLHEHNDRICATANYRRSVERAVVIANPAASQFTGGAHRDVMAVLNKQYEVSPIWPASGTDASEEARAAASAGVPLVIAMGGDGMVHHVAQGLIDTDSALGIIPTGTTNVIARVFDIPKSPSKAAKMLNLRRDPVSVGTLQMDITHGSIDSTHYSLFACGLGLDADVVVAADKEPYRKYRFGSLHYANSAFRVALGSFPRKKPNVAVRSGDRTTTVSAIAFQFRDVYTYFGRLALTLDQDKPDPVSALLVERLKRRRVPLIATKIFTGADLSKLGEVEVWSQVQTVSTTADPPIAAQADGESLGMVDAAEFVWRPESLNIQRGHSPG
jgi:diacylglycerol kinase family enzyme